MSFSIAEQQLSEDLCRLLSAAALLAFLYFLCFGAPVNKFEYPYCILNSERVEPRGQVFKLLLSVMLTSFSYDAQSRMSVQIVLGEASRGVT